MKWRFKGREQVENFLLQQFSEFDRGEVLNAFSWAFFEGKHHPTDQKRVWETRLRQQKKTITSRDSSEHLELEELWHRLNPKTGGSDPADHALVDWVVLAFEDLGAEITFGLSKESYGTPSTRFGRIVEAVMDYRRVQANWRRLAQTAASKARDGSE